MSLGLLSLPLAKQPFFSPHNSIPLLCECVSRANPIDCAPAVWLKEPVVIASVKFPQKHRLCIQLLMRNDETSSLHLVASQTYKRLNFQQPS